MMIKTISDAQGLVLAENIETDLLKLSLPDREFLIQGRMHLGNGKWKVWNSDNEYLDLTENNQ